jgi:homoserine acetyltransferase
MINVKEINDELKASLLDKYVQVKTELEKLYKKYGVSSFEELEKQFHEIPEEEGHDDYFIAHNLEALKRKISKLLRALEEDSE